jgi:hypothetical protein
MAATKSDILADRLQHSHHLLVEMPAMYGIPVGFALGEQCGDIVAHSVKPPAAPAKPAPAAKGASSKPVAGGQAR